jgi:hypothetical protein
MMTPRPSIEAAQMAVADDCHLLTAPINMYCMQTAELSSTGWYIDTASNI